MQLSEKSVYVPRERHERADVETFEVFRDALPERDRKPHTASAPRQR